MSDKKEYNVSFVNIELKFKPELYLQKGEALPDVTSLHQWLESMAKDFYRFGAGFNEQSRSFTASFTYRGGKPSEKPVTITQHGKSLLSAMQKLWVVFMVCGAFDEGFDAADERKMELEGMIEDAVQRLLE